MTRATPADAFPAVLALLSQNSDPDLPFGGIQLVLAGDFLQVRSGYSKESHAIQYCCLWNTSAELPSFTCALIFTSAHGSFGSSESTFLQDARSVCVPAFTASAGARQRFLFPGIEFWGTFVLHDPPIGLALAIAAKGQSRQFCGEMSCS